jgi:hypothetical protein
MTMLDYLKKSYNKNYDNPVGGFSLAGLRIYVKEPISNSVNLRECLWEIFGNMPKNLYSNVHTIMIGDFPFLRQRSVDATYQSGIIYVTNKHNDNYDFISDVIHEIAHAFEESHSQELYSDNEIRVEFLNKRKMLYNVLKAHNLLGSFDEKHFLDTHYNLNFDSFLYEKVGYEKLSYLTKDIFVSPYAATSLREYYANAFENFFINDIFIVQKYAPSVYKKLLKYLEI